MTKIVAVVVRMLLTVIVDNDENDIKIINVVDDDEF